MKGTDVSEDAIAAARGFLGVTSINAIPSDDQNITVNYGKLVRLMAWYGELRKHGDGSGRFVNNTREEKQTASQPTEGSN